jgi:hypothetical protein
MACCFPSQPVSERSRAIDKLLKQQGAEARKELKLLLLGRFRRPPPLLPSPRAHNNPSYPAPPPPAAGTGECGKSTIIKQMRIIHGTGYSEAERREFVALIHQNLILAMKAMLDALPALGLALEDESLKVAMAAAGNGGRGGGRGGWAAGRRRWRRGRARAAMPAGRRPWRRVGGSRLPALAQEPAADFLASVRDMLERAPVPLFKRLWKDAGLQAAYRRRREYQLNDSTA